GLHARRPWTTTSRSGHLASSTRTGPWSDRTRTVMSIVSNLSRMSPLLPRSYEPAHRGRPGEADPHGAVPLRGEDPRPRRLQALEHLGGRVPVAVAPHRDHGRAGARRP